MAPNIKDTRRRFILQSIQTWIIAFILLVSPTSALAQSMHTEQKSPLERENPAQRDNSILWNYTETALPDYQRFVEIIRNGQKGVLRGVYVPGVMALPIVQQPVGNPGFVSHNNDEITQFKMAADAGVVGLLAHNFLSGAVFKNLSVGDEVRLIFGDGVVEYFVVDQVLQYQALQPYSPNSDFRDLETNVTISANQLFGKVYRGERHVTFQTCIEADGNSSWGRLFIVAQPKLFPHAEKQYIRNKIMPLFY